MTTSDFLSVTQQDGPGGHRVLVVAGEIDRDSRDTLNGAAERATGEADPHLVIDLTGVTFCDSSGLSLFVDLHRRAQARGGWLRLAAPGPVLTDMLRITNLNRMLEVYDTVADATAEC